MSLFKRKKSNTVVFVGLTGSGKTVLFYQVSNLHFAFIVNYVLRSLFFTLVSETIMSEKFVYDLSFLLAGSIFLFS